MSAKHTPGPWFVDRLSEHGYLLVKPVGGQVVAQIDPVEEEEANARLIAAAPDLLDALKAAECTLANIQADISSGRLFSKDAVANLGRARLLALQVIDTAEGGES